MTSTSTTTTTTTQQQSVSGLTVQSQASTQKLGNFVTGISVNPYINSRVISFFGYNLRPNTLMHVFFNSVLVDSFCAQGIVPTVISNPADFRSIQRNGPWGGPIYTDANGFLAGHFYIPAATFKTGDTTLTVCDVNSIALGTAAITTQASAVFSSSNLNVTRQLTTLTTINPVIAFTALPNNVITTTNTSISITPTPQTTVSPYLPASTSTSVGHSPNSGASSDPLAQAFTVTTPDNSAGIFATSITIFFEQASLISNTTDNGVTLYVCETTNGYPDGTAVLPYSTTHILYNNVNTSQNASVGTTFTFQSPVFLNNGVEYAFVIAPDNSDPDYRVYTANLGSIDILTGYQVFSQPIVGTAFYGAVGTQWTALQTEYVKFTLNAAVFSNSVGDAYFNNVPDEFININSLSYTNTSSSILPNDVVYQATNSTVTTANTSILGNLKFFDNVKNVLYVSNSSGNFSTSNSFIQVHRFVNTSVQASPGPNTTTLIAWANTSGLYNPVVDALVGQFATIIPAGTSMVFDYKGVGNTYSADSAGTKITPGYETDFYDIERIVASRTNEVNSLSGNPSMTIHANMTTDSQFISPVIDTVRSQQLVIKNNIDPVTYNYNEYFNYGGSKSKYVSEVITLAPGQDSQDIQVIVSAHRPPGSSIKVFVKFLNGQDPDPISAKTWTPLYNTAYSLYSNPSNPNDMQDYAFSTISNYIPSTTNGTFTAANTSANLVGSSTQFTTDFQPGWYVTPASTTLDATRQILSITNNTFMTLNLPFNNSYTANALYKVVPPTTASLSVNNSILISGNVSVSNTTNIVTGNGTNFLSTTNGFLPGSIIQVNGDEQTVISVTNSTSLAVGTVWSSTVSGANAYLTTPAGITYLNSNSALYSTYLSFQVKIILQSNSTATIPILDNLRVLALQL